MKQNKKIKQHRKDQEIKKNIREPRTKLFMISIDDYHNLCSPPERNWCFGLILLITSPIHNISIILNVIAFPTLMESQPSMNSVKNQIPFETMKSAQIQKNPENHE